MLKIILMLIKRCFQIKTHPILQKKELLIEYEDRFGNITKRKIIPIAYDDYLLFAFCKKRLGFRSFNPEFILKCTDTKSGKAIKAS